MEKPKSSLPKTAQGLRQRAEELLRSIPADMPTMPTVDVQTLVYELNVHQVELEIQNEELRQAQLELSHSRDRYSDLYDFAPIGYVTLTKDGQILEANLTAAIFLGVERTALVGANLSAWIDRDAQDDWYLHRRAVFSSDARQNCEVNMHKADGTPVVVHLESIAFETGQEKRCRTALIDETILKHARQQLAESEQRYRRLTDAMTDYVYRVPVDHGRAGEIVHGANCEALTGFKAEEFLQNPRLWDSMVPREDRALVEQQVACLLSGKPAPPIDHRIQRKDGQIQWVLHTVSPEYDERGQLSAYDGLLRDITKRKEAETALNQLTETLEQRVAEQTHEVQLLAEAISHLAEGVVITDDELDWPGPRIRFVNQAMCRITGYTMDELVGKTPRVLQGAMSDAGTLEHLKSELAAGHSFQCELVNYRKNGTPYDAELFITPLFDSKGHRTNFVSIHRDITERKQAERELSRLAAIVQSSNDAITSKSLDGTIRSWNRAAERIYGYSAKEALGESIMLIVPPERREEELSILERFRRGEQIEHFETVRLCKERRPIDVSLSVSPIRDLAGRIVGASSIARDISERKTLQRQVLGIAEDEQRRIGQDLHDSTQQELSGLGMLAQTLLTSLSKTPDSSLGAQATKLRELATKIVKGIARTHQEVRSIARGLVPLRIGPQGLMDALRELAFRTDELDGVTCAFKCEQPVEVADSVTATHLYRIAQEAITNALRHGQPEHILIALEVDHGQPILQIADDGIGFNSMEASEGMGLKTMRYRASLIGATVTFKPVEAGGTLVSCRVSGGGDIR